MTMTAKFAGTCGRCQQRFAAGTTIDWERGKKAVHAGPCPPAPAQPVQQPIPLVPQLDATPIVQFLAAAKARGLKFPKVRFLAPGGGEMRLHVSGERSRVPGSVQVLVDGVWLGRIEPSGAVVGASLKSQTCVLDALATIAADPATAAKAYGALMRRCSFCHASLTDEGSVEVGYGKQCANNYGLPWQRGGVRELLPLVAAS